jgi:hypothetical protein
VYIAESAKAIGWANLMTNGDDNVTNALRHGSWQALLTAKLGAGEADAWAEAHENGSTSNGTPDSCRDRVNNGVGQGIGAGLSGLPEPALTGAVYGAVWHTHQNRGFAYTPQCPAYIGR